MTSLILKIRLYILTQAKLITFVIVIFTWINTGY